MKYSTLFIFLIIITCRFEKNIADCDEGHKSITCTQRTTLEDARRFLDNNEYDSAIEKFNEYKEENSEDFSFYPILAAAYAAKAGFDILGVVKNPTSSSGSSLSSQLDSFLPSKLSLGDVEYKKRIEIMKYSVNTLKEIPEEKRSATSAEKYAKSVIFQLTLYETAYSVMYINQFTISASTGDFDPEQLKKLTANDAKEILNSLASAASTQANPELAASINSTLDAINSSAGADDQEKLSNYLKSTQ